LPFEIRKTDLLLATDVQPDFCPGGALAVDDGDAVIEPINRLMDLFSHVAATQDWHPPSHMSFASSHADREPFEEIDCAYGRQILWPDHCVQGSAGAALHPALRTEPIEIVLRKGYHAEIDSYSAFVENDRTTWTGFAGYLRERGFTRIFCAGLALDYCVRYSAEDARKLGFEAVVITDACRAIAKGRELDDALAEMRASGVQFVASDDLLRAIR
jgi:nicotinamidase/pyrazinamidase